MCLRNKAPFAYPWLGIVEFVLGCRNASELSQGGTGGLPISDDQ